MSIDHPEAAARLVRETGGRVYETPELLQARGEAAVIGDPQGAVLVLIRAKSGDPPEHAPAVNEQLWHELWTEDTGKAANLYERLAGYRIERGHENKGRDTWC
jgi:predicted enzyme related to lactoylglutathione lyase